MRNMYRAMFLMLLFSSVSLMAQSHDHMSKKEAAPKKDAAPAKQPTMAEVLDQRVTSLEKWVVPAADAMPEEKYPFAPTNGEFTGVKTFTQQVRHIAAANNMFAATITGDKQPLDVNTVEMGPPEMTSKADIMKYLKDSFATLHKAVATINEKNATAPVPSPFGGNTNRLNYAVLAIGHDYDHYGQMVEYLRMNGIIPPASRKQ